MKRCIRLLALVLAMLSVALLAVACAKPGDSADTTTPKDAAGATPTPGSSDTTAAVTDANGNEVISTNEDIWKTNVEVEHTENEKMDDFINQLFM